MCSFDVHHGFLVPPYLTFPQASLRSRTVGFPESGSGLGPACHLPDTGLPMDPRLKHWFAYTPGVHGSPVSSSQQATHELTPALCLDVRD